MTDDDKTELAEAVVDSMISEMTLEQLRQYVWDSLYDELISQHWSNLLEYADRYAPETLENHEVTK